MGGAGDAAGDAEATDGEAVPFCPSPPQARGDPEFLVDASGSVGVNGVVTSPIVVAGPLAAIRARQPGKEPKGGGGCECGWASGTLAVESMKLCHRCHESVGGQSSSSESVIVIKDWLWNSFHGSLSTNGSVARGGLGLGVSTLVDWRVVVWAAQSGGKRGDSLCGGWAPSGTEDVVGVVETRVAQLGG